MNNIDFARLRALFSLLVLASLISGCTSFERHSYKDSLGIYPNKADSNKRPTVCENLQSDQPAWQTIAGDAKSTARNWRELEQHYREAPSRNIAIFIDGTGNVAATSTNIWKLYALATEQACSSPVIPFYHQGVGTRKFQRISGGIIGKGVDDLVKESYLFLSQTYRPGDKIFIFGFSRGAYAARALNGMIEFSGLLNLEAFNASQPADSKTLVKAVSNIYRIYHQYNDGKPEYENRLRRDIAEKMTQYPAYKDSQKVIIDAIGVFDTVPALGFMQDENPDQYRTNLYAKAGYHALAIDEERNSFRPLRFDDRLNNHQILKEVWFPGAHADVGGGYQDHYGLENLSRHWMLQQFSRFNLFPASAQNIKCPANQASCEQGQLHDEFLDSKLFNGAGLHIRRPLKAETLHNSVLCRYNIGELPTPHHGREPTKQYRPENLYLPIKKYYRFNPYSCMASDTN